MDYDIEKVSQELHIRPEVLRRIATSFATTLSAKIQDLQEAMAKDDVLKMRAILHEVRGTSGNLRLEDIFSSARTLHEAVKASEDKTNILEYFEALKSRLIEFS